MGNKKTYLFFAVALALGLAGCESPDRAPKSALGSGVAVRVRAVQLSFVQQPLRTERHMSQERYDQLLRYQDGYQKLFKVGLEADLPNRAAANGLTISNVAPYVLNVSISRTEFHCPTTDRCFTRATMMANLYSPGPNRASVWKFELESGDLGVSTESDALMVVKFEEQLLAAMKRDGIIG